MPCWFTVLGWRPGIPMPIIPGLRPVDLLSQDLPLPISNMETLHALIAHPIRCGISAVTFLAVALDQKPLIGHLFRFLLRLSLSILILRLFLASAVLFFLVLRFLILPKIPSSLIPAPTVDRPTTFGVPRPQGRDPDQPVSYRTELPCNALSLPWVGTPHRFSTGTNRGQARWVG